jgi:hypothetical protein
LESDPRLRDLRRGRIIGLASEKVTNMASQTMFGTQVQDFP